MNSPRKRINLYKNFTGPPYIRPIGTIKAIAGHRVVVHCPYYGYPIRYFFFQLFLLFFRSDFFTPFHSLNFPITSSTFGNDPKFRTMEIPSSTPRGVKMFSNPSCSAALTFAMINLVSDAH